MHYLMSKNEALLEIESARILVTNTNKLPWALQLNRRISYTDIHSWVSSRALPLNRKNAENIYRVMGLHRDNSEVKLMYLTHALSINDNYWIADESELGSLRYENISIFNNSFNKAMYLVALKGEEFTITDKIISAEFTGQGTFPKCFMREADGIYLYKNSHSNGMKHEIISGRIAEILGLRSAHYEIAEVGGVQCTKSKILSNQNVNWETADSLVEFFGCTNFKIPQEFALKNLQEQYVNMIVFDAIVLNSDRHMKNWALEFNSDTNQLIGLAPSYDYNNTFELRNGGESNLIFDGHYNKRVSVLRAGRIAYRDFKCTLNIQKLLDYINNTENIGVSKYALYNRIMYITGNKPNMNDCF